MRTLCILLACVFVVPAALGLDYPSKPGRIIVGQPFVVENRVGGGTVLGTQTAAAAAPDGYTLVMGGLANMAFNLAMHKDLRYDPIRDFTP
ncbi:MAG TPA: tripartite tricarboxylate transporter substrate-binding protein, partial [Burkholderiales bacterium]|nr:tripartite tricarboxylate transporter substrate-binding protein [Burkholderiales bacterium]